MQIMLLGDLMGTKSLLMEQASKPKLQGKYTLLTRSFTECYSRYHKRSRSLFCLTFSDCVIAIWDDFYEGRRYAHLFARDLHISFLRSELIARIFLDKGDVVSSSDERFELYAALEARFINFSPISIGAWSVFRGESGHFAPGVYVGDGLVGDLLETEGVSFSDISCRVGQFAYRQMIVESS